MTNLFDCIQNGMDGGEIDAPRGKAAQRMWRAKTGEFLANGADPLQAEALAAEAVKKVVRRQALIDKHRLTAHLADMGRAQKTVAALTPEQMKRHLRESVRKVDFDSRTLTRYAQGQLGEILKEIHPDWKGAITNPATMTNVVRHMQGDATGEALKDTAAQKMAEAAHRVLEELRVMHNAAGGYIPKMDGYFPHQHNPRTIRRAGFNEWSKRIIQNKRLDWTKIESHATGTPFQTPGGPAPSEDVQKAFLKEIYNNIVHGKDLTPQYGKPQGKAMYKRRAGERVMVFRSTDDWIAYNKEFGSGDAFGALMSHVRNMSHDIAAMRNFGPNPALGLDYRAQLVKERKVNEDIDEAFGDFDADHAARMLRVFSGPIPPTKGWMEYSATFFSNTRHALTAAFLDRASIASFSDFNSMRLVAETAGLSRSNMLAHYGRTLSDMVKEGNLTTMDLRRSMWVLDTVSDPVATMARFQTEVPASEVFERLSHTSFRVQGLSQHTDTAKYAVQATFWGEMADHADRSFREVQEANPAFAKTMTNAGITPEDWDAFRAGGIYEAGNGATFLNPLYWRAGSKLPADQRDRIFFKFQGMLEEWTERGVPTRDLEFATYIDPTAYGVPAGHPAYELAKSIGMFKSFPITFTVNQYRMMMAQPALMGSVAAGRAAYAINMAAGATVMGALALQTLEVLKGNDPVDVLEHPEFWGKAALKGGGFGVIGDILATGTTKWGAGLPEYASGPMVQAFGDAMQLTVGNAWEFATGQETNAGKEWGKAVQRYMPMADTPVAGLAADRLFFDQLQMVLDPEGRTALEKAARLRQNRDGNAEWWPSAEPVPARAPDLSAAFGG